MFKTLNNFDMNLIMLIHNFTQCGVLDKIMPYITYIGNNGFIWIAISAILLANKKYRYAGIMCIFSLILSAVLCEGLLKNIVRRPRPFMSIPNLHILIPEPSGYSFPSGHAASSFAAAGILFKEFKRYRIYPIILAVLISFSRIYLFVHYPIDVLSGAVLGFLCSSLVLHAAAKLRLEEK